MGFLLKAYIISIIFCIIGFVILGLRVIGYCKEHNLTKEKRNKSIYSILSVVLSFIVFSLLPVFNIIIGCILVFCTEDLARKAIKGYYEEE